MKNLLMSVILFSAFPLITRAEVAKQTNCGLEVLNQMRSSQKFGDLYLADPVQAYAEFKDSGKFVQTEESNKELVFVNEVAWPAGHIFSHAAIINPETCSIVDIIQF